MTIDRPAAGGEMIARHDGRIVFVTGAIPGERVTVEIADPAAKLWRGHAVDILRPSKHRVAQQCGAAAQGAGCCDWGFISPEYAAHLKSEILMDCLRRLGHFDESVLPTIDVVPLAPATHWRTRVRLGVDVQGRAGLHRARSRELVVGVPCAQNCPGLTDGLATPETVPLGFLQSGIAAESRRQPPRGQLHVAVDARGNRSVVYDTASRGRVRGRGAGAKRRDSFVAIEGGLSTEHTVHGVTFDVPTTGFWQAHRNAPQFYGDRVIELLRAQTITCAWDLYGGVGVLAAALRTIIEPGGSVLSVEGFAGAAAAGRKAFRAADSKAGAESAAPVRFVTGDVEAVVRREVNRDDRPRPEAVVLDPPRTGAGRAAINAIAAAKPRTVIHIGCDPATFARDARYWVDQGYRMTHLEVVDAFGLTHHVETIAVLRAS